MGSNNHSRHVLLNSLVTMSEAITLAHLSTVQDATRPDAGERAAMAHRLSGMVALYALSPGREEILKLTVNDLRGARFAEEGDLLEFDDGRAPVVGLCMTRAALNAAIESIKRARP
jgi:hypothetical protein